MFRTDEILSMLKAINNQIGALNTKAEISKKRDGEMEARLDEMAHLLADVSSQVAKNNTPRPTPVKKATASKPGEGAA